MLQERLGISQRRACQIVGQHRSTQRHAPAEADPDRELRDELRRSRVIRGGGIAVRTPCWSGRVIT